MKKFFLTVSSAIALHESTVDCPLIKSQAQSHSVPSETSFKCSVNPNSSINPVYTWLQWRQITIHQKYKTITIHQKYTRTWSYTDISFTLQHWYILDSYEVIDIFSSWMIL